MKRCLAALCACCLLIGLGLLSGCANPQESPAKFKLTENVKTIAVLPYQRVLPNPSLDGAVCCPITGAIYTGGEIIPGAENVLDQALAERLPKITDLKILPKDEVFSVYQETMGRSVDGNPLRQQLAEVGRKLGADAVLVGSIYRFRQRKGTNLAAEQPASVAFDLIMISSANAGVLWKSTFDWTQQSLSENLFRFSTYAKYGLIWYTADQLGIIGMEQILADFPWKKPGLAQQ